MTIRALITDKDGEGYATKLTNIDQADLGEGDVTISVEYSTVNYKDGLALNGKRIMTSYPMIGGIDLAGTVEASDSINFQPGDKVLVNGYGLSQTHNGGYSEKARVPAEWVIPLPEKFSTRDAMAIGTAGYTAMLCILALEHGGLTPASGDVLVTGANGGVGSIAISILSGLGYNVLASTGRPSAAED
ncbi:MAG TPA: oxidoreductase, partial [Hyphomonadaceae bacterium]|nr:oxidoreductase [Hyphomonadaceae bacterium]